MPVPRGKSGLSESASLVQSTDVMSYTEEAGSILQTSSQEDCPPDAEEDFIDSDVSVLAQFHEDAIRQAGFGYFQWLLMFVLGLGLSADRVEFAVISYIIPSAEVEMCISGEEKAWLVSISFLGMMVGGVLWGNLADCMGRRRTLLSALSVNSVFGIIAAFMPTYGTFMTARFCSGVGIGGVLPIVFATYSEFLSKSDRGKCLSWLSIFWALGGIFVTLMAWLKLPRTGVDVVLESKEHFSAWHQFLLICALPSIAAVIGLTFVPESPRYLLEACREVEAMMVYQRVYKTNNIHKPSAHVQYQLSELELPSKRPTGRHTGTPPSPGKSVLADMTYSIETFWNSFLQLFVYPYIRISAVLIVMWFTFSFGYYGLTVWFPDYIKMMKIEQYKQKAQFINGLNFTNITFNESIENHNYRDCGFYNVTFNHITLSHVIFDNCTMENVEFSNIKTNRTYFKNSTIKDSRFVDTNLSDKHFENCQRINNTILSLTAGCQLDFDYNIYLEETFEENLVLHISILLGAFVSGFIIDKLGRVKTMGISMFLTSVSGFFIWFLDNSSSVIAFEAVFNFIFISGWNAINIATTESYPTHLRTTGYGFLSATCHFAGTLGINTFSSIIASSRAVPMLTAAVVIVIGGIVSVKLPETKSVLL